MLDSISINMNHRNQFWSKSDVVTEEWLQVLPWIQYISSNAKLKGNQPGSQ
jgi:hypothetical protein